MRTQGRNAPRPALTTYRHTAEAAMSPSFDEAPLLPGLKPVLELLTNEPQRVDLVFCKKGLRSPDVLAIQQHCRKHGIRFSLLEAAALDRLCRNQQHGRDNVAHQGVIARLAVTSFCSLETLLDAVAHAPLPLLLALDQVQDPGNVGTLCRTLYALGGAGLILPRHNSAYLGPAARRAAAGALEQLPVAQVTNLGHALDSAEEAGLTIYGTGGPGDARSCNAFQQRMRLPAVLVLGNEERGLRPGVAKRCAHMLHIPLARPFDSLNVAQAGAILLALTASAS
ncbi:MAG: RNA methyltransferase [Desulfovibrionaceae bacterium]|nr:RNA methyltransferase [Desulfovibrionaceae bacterium]